jgi:hypothetical protein
MFVQYRKEVLLQSTGGPSAIYSLQMAAFHLFFCPPPSSIQPFSFHSSFSLLTLVWSYFFLSAKGLTLKGGGGNENLNGQPLESLLFLQVFKLISVLSVTAGVTE